MAAPGAAGNAAYAAPDTAPDTHNDAGSAASAASAASSLSATQMDSAGPATTGGHSSGGSAAEVPEPVCAACHAPIGDLRITSAMGREWHSDCFRCVARLAERRCRPSRLSVRDDSAVARAAGCVALRRAHGARRTRRCRTRGRCVICEQPIVSYFFEHDGRPYCQRDYDAMTGHRCAGCGGIINGPVMAAHENLYHSECFTCQRCQRLLGVGEQFALLNSQLYCDTCAEHLKAGADADAEAPLRPSSPLGSPRGSVPFYPVRVAFIPMHGWRSPETVRLRSRAHDADPSPTRASTTDTVNSDSLVGSAAPLALAPSSSLGLPRGRSSSMELTPSAMPNRGSSGVADRAAEPKMRANSADATFIASCGARFADPSDATAPTRTEQPPDPDDDQAAGSASLKHTKSLAELSIAFKRASQRFIHFFWPTEWPHFRRRHGASLAADMPLDRDGTSADLRSNCTADAADAVAVAPAGAADSAASATTAPSAMIVPPATAAAQPLSPMPLPPFAGGRPQPTGVDSAHAASPSPHHYHPQQQLPWQQAVPLPPSPLQPASQPPSVRPDAPSVQARSQQPQPRVAGPASVATAPVARSTATGDSTADTASRSDAHRVPQRPARGSGVQPPVQPRAANRHVGTHGVLAQKHGYVDESAIGRSMDNLSQAFRATSAIAGDTVVRGNMRSVDDSARPLEQPEPPSGDEVIYGPAKLMPRKLSVRIFRMADLEIGECIGRGFFGCVYRVRHKATGAEMVLKELLRYDKESRVSFLKEVSILKTLHHPNILQFIGVFVKDNQLNLVTEYISGGTLRKVIKHKEIYPMPWPQRLQMAHHIARGMAYLHYKHMIHRDLKSKNCLVRADMSIVVADFGLARSVVAAGERLTIAGSPYWMAPEMLRCVPARRPLRLFDAPCLRRLTGRRRRGEDYGPMVDVFSYGIVLCEIISRLKADPDELPRTHQVRTIGRSARVCACVMARPGRRGPLHSSASTRRPSVHCRIAGSARRTLCSLPWTARCCRRISDRPSTRSRSG